jgi:DNA-binding SARP family transcriptional activator
LLRSGEFAAAVAEAEALLAELPLDEGAWEILIRGLSGGGRTAEALDAYRRAYDESLTDPFLTPPEAFVKDPPTYISPGSRTD